MVEGTASEATFKLNNPFKDETKEVKVSVNDVDGGSGGSFPW